MKAFVIQIKSLKENENWCEKFKWFKAVAEHDDGVKLMIMYGDDGYCYVHNDHMSSYVLNLLKNSRNDLMKKAEKRSWCASEDGLVLSFWLIAEDEVSGVWKECKILADRFMDWKFEFFINQPFSLFCNITANDPISHTISLPRWKHDIDNNICNKISKHLSTYIMYEIFLFISINFLIHLLHQNTKTSYKINDNSWIFYDIVLLRGQ